MTINFKRFKGRYIVKVDGKLFRFADITTAHTFIEGIVKYGFEYDQEVHEKIRCLYQLYELKGRPDSRENAVRKMLLACESSILMDNAIHGIFVGDYTLDDILKRKGFM